MGQATCSTSTDARELPTPLIAPLRLPRLAAGSYETLGLGSLLQ